MSSPEVVVLVALITPFAAIRNNTEALEQILQVRRVPYKIIDGSDAENEDIRNYLWELADKKFSYPLVFFRHTDKETGEQTYDYVGDYASIHVLNENNAEHFGFDRLFAKIPGFTPTPSTVASAGGYEKEEVGETTVDVSARATAIDETVKAQEDGDDSTITDSLGNVWTRHFDSHGMKYWYCRKTRESSWVDPRSGTGDDGAWIPMISPKGKKYYYNRKTGESAWELPT